MGRPLQTEINYMPQCRVRCTPHRICRRRWERLPRGVHGGPHFGSEHTGGQVGWDYSQYYGFIGGSPTSSGQAGELLTLFCCPTISNVWEVDKLLPFHVMNHTTTAPQAISFDVRYNTMTCTGNFRSMEIWNCFLASIFLKGFWTWCSQDQT